MANGPIPPKAKIYYAPYNAGYMLGADKIDPEEVYPNGKVRRRSRVISFRDHLYKTDRKTEQEYIENSDDFRLKRVVLITDEEVGKLRLVKSMIKSGTPVSRDSDEFDPEGKPDPEDLIKDAV